MREVIPHTIELIGGYTDPKTKVTHRRVIFGKRFTGRLLFNIDSDPQSSLETQHSSLILRACITEFGTLKMPVPLTVLLGLDSIDRDDLNEGFNQFSLLNEADSKPEFLTTDTVKLAFGYESNGLTYDLVKFGQRLTGMHDVEADKLRLTGIQRVCFLAGRQVVKLAQSHGASELDGPVELQIFEQLDSVDINAIRAGSEIYRQSFRLGRKGLPGERSS